MPATPAEIVLALFTRLSEFPTDLPISWPEQPDDPDPFEVPEDGKYLEATYFLNRPQWEGLASGKVSQGLLQVSVIWPKQQGLIEPYDIVGRLFAHFPKAHRMPAGLNGVAAVKVSAEPYASSPIPDDVSVTIAVTVPWTA